MEDYQRWLQPWGVTELPHIQLARQDDDNTLPGDHGKAVKCASKAYEEGLLLFAKGDHIVAVRGDVIGGGGKGSHPETGQGGDKKTLGRRFVLIIIKPKVLWALFRTDN